MNQGVGLALILSWLSIWQILATALAENTPCEFDGVIIQDHASKYLVGKAHRRGSIFGLCDNGILTCYEDNGIADAPTLSQTEVSCSTEEISSRRRRLGIAVNLEEDIWPNGLVWYRISTNFSSDERAIIEGAIALYNSIDVNITFQECEPATICNSKYVSIEQNEDGCYGYVGYVDTIGPQLLNLGESCFDGLGSTVHELGHTLGLYHEHTHPDRQVIILTDTNLPVSASNYAVETDAVFKPYDLSSIMHYGTVAGLCLPKDEYPLASFCDVETTHNCVMPVQGHCNETRNSEFGQQAMISARDLDTLKALYGSRDGKNRTSVSVPIPLMTTGSSSGSASSAQVVVEAASATGLTAGAEARASSVTITPSSDSDALTEGFSDASSYAPGDVHVKDSSTSTAGLDEWWQIWIEHIENAMNTISAASATPEDASSIAAATSSFTDNSSSSWKKSSSASMSTHLRRI